MNKPSKLHTVLVIIFASLFGASFDVILALTGFLDTIPKIALAVIFTVIFVFIVLLISKIVLLISKKIKIKQQ